jgi:alpha-L-fucosidase 2
MRVEISSLKRAGFVLSLLAMGACGAGGKGVTGAAGSGAVGGGAAGAAGAAGAGVGTAGTGGSPTGTAGNATGAAGTATGTAGAGPGAAGGTGTGGAGTAGAGGGSTAGGAGAAGGASGAAGAAGGATGAAGTSAPGTTVVDGPTGEAFDTARGTLNVDYAGYFSKHDVVYNKANTNALYGLPVGNGRVGALVWSANNGLTMQVSGVDTSQQTAFGAGNVSFTTNPALDAGSTTFQQRLALFDGALSTTYDANRTVTILGAAGSEVIGIHVADTRTGVTSATLDLSLWDVSALGNSGNVPSIDTWKKVTTWAEAASAGLSRGQTDANNFGYSLGATVEGATFTTQAVNASTVRLTITPTASYTIWIACASRLDAANHDSVTQAKAALASTAAAGFATTSAAYTSFWHGFWGKSFVQYSNAAGDADYLENVYDLATYMIAAGTFGNYPFHFINGVERATGDMTKWSNAYWFWNQRDVYNSFLASNHPDVLNVFNNLYSRNFDALKAFTMKRFGIDGLWVPETMGWNGNADGNTQYTNDIFSTATEAARNMFAQFSYTGDQSYLTKTAYPFMREVAKFYVKKFTKDAGSGKYVMTLSNAHETYWGVPNAITDLAAVRSLFPSVIAASTTLGLDADLRPQWQDLLTNLTAYPTDGTHYLPHQPPIAQTHNNENVASEIIWPYDQTGIDAPDYAMAVATWKARPNPYGNVWANDAIQAARLGLGDDANQGMKTMLQKYQNYPNGMTNNTNGVFEYLGVHLAVMNESLLQSYNGKIRVFPALPNDAGLVTRFSLAASGGFLVTSEREGGDIKYVGLRSNLGNMASVINPWGTAAVQVRKIGAAAPVLSASSSTLTFATEAGGVYVVERVAKPLGGYTFAFLTGKANQDVKHLGTATSLGIGK